MKRIILTLTLLSALLVGCSQKGRVIPPETMSNIYVDMFLADQWLRDHSDFRDKADTTLFFEPIFNKYGYSYIDYDASIDHYAADMDQFSEITTAATVKLRQMKEKYEKLVATAMEVRLKNSELMLDYVKKDFSTDSSRWQTGKVLWPEFEMPDSLIVAGVEESDTLEFSRPQALDEIYVDKELEMLELDGSKLLEFKR